MRKSSRRPTDDVQRLLIVSHVPHFQVDGQLFAYAPYAREIEVWCDLFPQVVIAAPLADGPPPGDCHRLRRANVRLHPMPLAGGSSVGAKLRQLMLLPSICWRLTRAMRSADAIHVRCPGNLGLLGVLLGPLYSRRLVAKYAGTWVPYPGEPRTVRLQRWLLRSRWWRGPVTVYGDWPDMPPHVIAFFTSIMTAQDVARAKAAARRRRPSDVLRILYVGRLSQAKHVDVLVRAVGQLVTQQIAVEGTVIGEGPERERLEELVRSLRLQQIIRFTGGLEFQQVLDHYEQGDVLVLASDSEGWPKAIAEGMAFGLACVGANRGLVPWMLGEGRGMVVPPGEVAPLAAALAQLAADPTARAEMSRRAADWAQRYTLESLCQALRQLLEAHWGSPASTTPRSMMERPQAADRAVLLLAPQRNGQVR